MPQIVRAVMFFIHYLTIEGSQQNLQANIIVNWYFSAYSHKFQKSVFLIHTRNWRPEMCYCYLKMH